MKINTNVNMRLHGFFRLHFFCLFLNLKLVFSWCLMSVEEIEVRSFSVITTKWNHHCSVLYACLFCSQAGPLVNTWNWNTRRTYGHLRYYSGPSTLLCSIHFQMMLWCIIWWLFWRGGWQKSLLLSYSLFKIWLVLSGWVVLLLWCTCKNWVKGLHFWREMTVFTGSEFAL